MGEMIDNTEPRERTRAAAGDSGCRESYWIEREDAVSSTSNERRFFSDADIMDGAVEVELN